MTARLSRHTQPVPSPQGVGNPRGGREASGCCPTCLLRSPPVTRLAGGYETGLSQASACAWAGIGALRVLRGPQALREGQGTTTAGCVLLRLPLLEMYAGGFAGGSVLGRSQCLKGFYKNYCDRPTPAVRVLPAHAPAAANSLRSWPWRSPARQTCQSLAACCSGGALPPTHIRRQTPAQTRAQHSSSANRKSIRRTLVSVSKRPCTLW